MVTPCRKSGMPCVLDSGLRRSDGVVISYAIVLFIGRQPIDFAVSITYIPQKFASLP